MSANYFVWVNAHDDSLMPTQPDPVPLLEVGAHVAAFLKRYEHQGYYSNCRQERIPLADVTFTLVQEES